MFLLKLIRELYRSVKFAQWAYGRMKELEINGTTNQKVYLDGCLKTKTGWDKLEMMLINPWRLHNSNKTGKFRYESIFERYVGTRLAVSMHMQDKRAETDTLEKK